MKIQSGKKRPEPILAEPVPADIVEATRPVRALMVRDESGVEVILSPTSDAFDLWLAIPGRGAVGVSLTPATVLRLAWWVVVRWWCLHTLFGVRARWERWQARRAMHREEGV